MYRRDLNRSSTEKSASLHTFNAYHTAPQPVWPATVSIVPLLNLIERVAYGQDRDCFPVTRVTFFFNIISTFNSHFADEPHWFHPSAFSFKLTSLSSRHALHNFKCETILHDNTVNCVFRSIFETVHRQEMWMIHLLSQYRTGVCSFAYFMYTLLGNLISVDLHYNIYI